MFPEELAEAIRQEIRKIIRDEIQGGSPFVQATWKAAESVDANLSHIQILGVDYHFIPKLSSVGALVDGDQVICIRSRALPLTIIGETIGDITLASAGPN